MARPKLHDEATAEALLTAAAELLLRGGPGAVSVRAVADASGTSFRAVYALFGSKQALMDGLSERGYAGLAARVRQTALTDDAVDDLVRAGSDVFRAFALEEPALFRLTFEQMSSAALAQERVARAALDSYQVLHDRVRHVRGAGGIHDDRTDEQCVLEFHCLCQGLASAELAAREPPDGPGFWPMARHLHFPSVWRDALGGLVRNFATAPTSE